MKRELKPSVARRKGVIAKEGQGLWKLEWVVAIVPMSAWFFAYYFESGVYAQASVPNALFDVDFMRMLGNSAFALIYIAGLALGASGVVQQFYGQSKIGCIVAIGGAFALGIAFMWLWPGTVGLKSRWPLIFLMLVCVYVGLYGRLLAKPGGKVWRHWESGYLRIMLIFFILTFGSFAAHGLGKYNRKIQQTYAVLETPCGPLTEVFRVRGDSVILVPMEFGPTRTGVASLSSLGELSIRYASRDEVRHRINFVGPCAPSRPEGLGLWRKP